MDIYPDIKGEKWCPSNQVKLLLIPLSRRKYTKSRFSYQYYGRIIQKIGTCFKYGTVWEKLRSIFWNICWNNWYFQNHRPWIYFWEYHLFSSFDIEQMQDGILSDIQLGFSRWLRENTDNILFCWCWQRRQSVLLSTVLHNVYGCSPACVEFVLHV